MVSHCVKSTFDFSLIGASSYKRLQKRRRLFGVNMQICRPAKPEMLWCIMGKQTGRDIGGKGW